jgi:hypothetical protein
MNPTSYFPSRRRFLATSAAGAAWLMRGGSAWGQAAASIPPVSDIYLDGPSGPYPISWLDKNGSHNQAAGPDLEPSHIFHFNGRVARCSGFSGMGRDGKNERVLFGTKTTDYGIIDGEYWAARAPQASRQAKQEIR